MRKVLWGGLALLALATVTAGILVARGVVAGLVPAESYVTKSMQARGPGVTPPVLFLAPTFDLASAGGPRVSLSGLAGKVWIANFLFTECTSVCPTLTARLVQLERELTSFNLRFVSVSVDPEHDTPEALRAYARSWRSDPRWLLLGATREERDDIARGFRVAVVPSSDAKNPILHSRLLWLVDGEGRVRGVYDSDDTLAWKRIAADAAELARAASPEPSPSAREVAGTGSPVARFGCNGCHDRAAVAPRLAGGERAVTLDTGEIVMADEAYVRESLLDPAAKVVAGYAPLMPSYKGALTRAEQDELVAAIRALPPPPSDHTAATPPGGGAAEDPICHMKVATVNPQLTLKVGDQTHHFCSRACLDAFAANAARGQR
jgi:protein SCO1/2